MCARARARCVAVHRLKWCGFLFSFLCREPLGLQLIGNHNQRCVCGYQRFWFMSVSAARLVCFQLNWSILDMQEIKWFAWFFSFCLLRCEVIYCENVLGSGKSKWRILTICNQFSVQQDLILTKSLISDAKRHLSNNFVFGLNCMPASWSFIITKTTFWITMRPCNRLRPPLHILHWFACFIIS